MYMWARDIKAKHIQKHQLSELHQQLKVMIGSSLVFTHLMYNVCFVFQWEDKTRAMSAFIIAASAVFWAMASLSGNLQVYDISKVDKYLCTVQTLAQLGNLIAQERESEMERAA